MNIGSALAAFSLLALGGMLSHGLVDTQSPTRHHALDETECSSIDCQQIVAPVSEDPDTVVPSIYGTSLRYGMDTTDSPCNDLYGYVNDGWRSQAVLPKPKRPGSQMVTFFNHVNRSMRNRLIQVLDSARREYATTERATFRALGVFYESCMVADTLESQPFKRRKRDSTAKDSTRAEQCVDRVRRHFGEVAGQYFAEDLIRTQAVTRMEALLAGLKTEVGNMLQANSLMTPDEKRYAINRLDRLVLRVGIPKEMVDYSGLHLDPKDYHGNKIAILNFFGAQWVNAIGDNVREQWKASLLMANAMYLPSDHAIEIPTLMFSPPFFYADGDDLLNYAGIGYVIGHEIFHSVSMQLPQIEDPRMKREIDRFIDFNTSMGERDSWVANGKRTFKEDVADLGGGRVAYRAWRAARKAHGPESDSLIEGLTPDQRFFIALGRIWRSKWDGGAPNHDVHAPHFARVNATVMQIPQFASAFGCKEGDAMYLTPDHLSKIW